MTNAATEAQNLAARPNNSTWLTANAGSGKTRVLTNRVARLLLTGVRPESILCLTYTKAAASEMQNRLFRTLGTWAMLRDDALRDELAKLGEHSAQDLGRARTLFASAIEAPGGLKIQTIHSFCSKVLRQFPLEAGVNPQFREMDDTLQSDVIRDVVRDIALEAPSALANVRRVYSGDDIVTLAKDISKNEDRFQRPLDPSNVFAAFGMAERQTVDDIAASAFSAGDIEFLKSLAPILRAMGTKTDQKLAAALEQLDDRPNAHCLAQLEDCLLLKTGDNAFTAKRSQPTKSVRESAEFSPLLPRLIDISERVEVARRQRIALTLASDTVALHTFASAFLPRYQSAKSSRGVLDFDDLIRRTRSLLGSRSLEWVLYRLDARIDHVLVDEAQDTSPTQWDVIEALTGEMVAGESARNRTLFVVGDKKQSIYSFQGADAAGYDARGEAFQNTLAVGEGMEKGELLYSFRSSSAVLNCVDAVFRGPDGTGEETKHIAFHDSMPGRVDLWPLVPQPDEENELPWYDARYRTVENDAAHQLATKVADEIQELIESGTIQGQNGENRAVHAGDIMVLVQRRSKLFDKIISACKSRDLPIAGADRLKVGSELAVRDLLALLSFLALPEDDLSLAAALRSPLFGWSEQDLFELAAKRPEKTFLWQSMRDRRDDFPETYERLVALRKQVDFLRPYELISEILIKHGGRRRFLERLGTEAEDGIDELLNQALAFETLQAPSLTGFLEVARSSDADVKREAETAGQLIRVMTVHGAKGLESPIVILPDTTMGQPYPGQAIVEGPGGIATLTRSKEKSTPELQAAKDAKQQAENAERDRLLYVAMTRAESWLIVCGVKPSREDKNRLNWHEKIEAGMRTLGADTLETPTGQGLRYAIGACTEMQREAVVGETAELPRPVAPEFGPLPTVTKPPVLAPSNLGDAKVLPGEASEGSGGARKGRQMHVLLEHLPLAEDKQGLAAHLLAKGPDAATDAELAVLLDDVQQTLDRYPHLFGPGSMAEVDIVGVSPSLGCRVSGAIDRLVVEDSRVLAVDYKTNARVPETPEDTPEGILRQMGAYLELLEAIYPDHDVEVAILWTATGELMPLGHGIVRAALQRATIS